MTGFFTSWS